MRFRLDAVVVFAVVLGSGVGCNLGERGEPAYGLEGCHVSALVCYSAEKVAALDIGSPMWAYCATRPVVAAAGFVGQGRSESWFTWGADGAIEDVRVDCRPGADVHHTAMRDAQGRVAGYHDTWNDYVLQYEFGDDGLLESALDTPAVVSTGPLGPLTSTWSWEYDEGTRLRTSRYQFAVGRPFERAHEVDLGYEDDAVSLVHSVSSGAIESDRTLEISRDAGRIVEIKSGTGPSISGYHAAFDWTDDQHMQSTVESVLGTTEGRYVFDDGRLSYVEEDLAGEPLTTAWYEYDDEGRLTHLVWWGHYSSETESRRHLRYAGADDYKVQSYMTRQ